MPDLKTFRLTAATLALALALALLSACSSDKGEDNAPADSFDRAAMLTNYSDQLIVPGFRDLSEKTTQLQARLVALAGTPTAAAVLSAREALREASLAWQAMSSYEFGPAEQQMLRSNLNVYPTSTTQIESNIAAGTYDLNAASNLAAKGFPALDYLLYDGATPETVAARFGASANRADYAVALGDQLRQLTEATYNGWLAGGYTSTFQQATGTAVGSSVANLVNQLNSDIDMTKRYKVGIPGGRFTAGTPQPLKAEAPYGNLSLELLKRNVQAERNLFLGQTGTTNGPGLDDYLTHVNAQYNGKPLAGVIEQQFNAVLTAIDAVPGPLTQAVVSQPATVNKVYDEFQKLIVLTKTDMPSALGVSITYTDNDGD
ncbi:imelysin family protein [Hymenobacter sp. NST-14]|uniref:imelysin family protein n=1 Tax=Hymenobacter piscis TaxID=2839984 RepID=UPI001C035F77|nr:imelysin family protein [Hymenobacter piscis]MBT9392792.1 imelysin family protein [Hymenobacter piscis]